MNEFGMADVKAGVLRAAAALERSSDELTRLDQALGDGDLGITAEKAAQALHSYVASTTAESPGRFLIEAGMSVNRAAASTMGTLIATAMMRAGKALGERRAFEAADLALLLEAADEGIRARGKAKTGDKTIVDALHPAAEAFREHMTAGAGLAAATEEMLRAAREGRDSVTPLRSRIGRAGWVGERTEGAVDPGCELLVVVLEAVSTSTTAKR